MSFTLLSAITAAYTGIAISEVIKAEFGQAIIYSGYAFANIGLMMGMR